MAAVAEPRGSWLCRRRGPGAWPPVERQPNGACEAAGVQPHAEPPCCPSAVWRPLPLSGAHLGPDLESRPQLQPHGGQEVFFCQQGQGLPVNPLFSENLGWGGGRGAVSGPECWGCVSQGGLGSPEKAEPRDPGGATWGKCQKKENSSVEHVPMLEAEALTRGEGAFSRTSLPQSLRSLEWAAQ